MIAHEVMIDGVAYVPKSGSVADSTGVANVAHRARMVHLERVPLRKVQVRDSCSVKTWEGWTDDCHDSKWVGAGGQYALIVPCPNETTAYALKGIVERVCADAKAQAAETK